MALCIGCLACSLALHAGEVILVGDVLNEATGEPIPNVHLYLQGTQQGTVSNEEGSFCLRADIDRKRRLIISAVGYHTQRYDIEPNTMAGMQVLLREKTNLLAEVVALPGENPAIPLIAQVRAHRAFNDRTLQSQEQETKSQDLLGSEQTWVASTELYISHIGKRQLQRHLWKSLRAGLLTTDDSTFLLPLYRSTQPVQLIGKEMRPAGEKQEQALILSASDYSVLLTPPQNLNFYLNSLDILGESFLSPLASSGNTYYHYFLADSVPGAYLVHFRTKNPFYATFNGEMWIDSATYAVQSVYAEVPAQSRVNYLSQLQIHQQFAPDHSLRHEQISVLLDFAVKTDTTHLFPTVLMRTEIRPTPALPTREGERIVSIDGGSSKPSPFGVPASNAQRGTLVGGDGGGLLDSLPLIRVAKFAATVLTTGYIPTGTCVDIGNIREIVDFGESEWVHLGLPLRTNERLWKNVSLEAAAGYGFHDQRWKGLGRISINLPTLRRNILRIEYEDHYIATEVDGMYSYYHENFFGKRRFDLTALLFRNLYTNAQAVNTYSRQREFRIETENDWSDLLETRLYAHVGRWDPWYTEHATRNLAPGILATAPYRYQSIGAVFRLSWGERKVDSYFLRRYVHSQYPTLFLSAEAGSVQDEG
ncbi:MAG: carboxypeptidase-like regulatory domain-containing protein, partial [Paludibacteraceae bacterium]